MRIKDYSENFLAQLSTLSFKHSSQVSPDIIIVIPCYKEPDILKTLYSLFDCDRGNFVVEIILLLNSHEIDSEDILEMNRQSYQEAFAFAEKNNAEDFFLIPFLIENLPGHQTGAGLPRKIGMDEAIRHFKGKKDGILVSLDADCTVEKNYLTEIYRQFKQYKLNSATIEFHHPVDHLDDSEPMKEAMLNYELYLRYYRKALEFIGYPYAYYTIGSAFAVTADVYTKVGGMGQQQSGEDFYFLQKVFPLGKTRFIDTTKVYPAARVSDRIPFGTGPALAKMLKENETQKFTYQFNAFVELKKLFDKINNFYQVDTKTIRSLIQDLPEFTIDFLEENDFFSKMEEINSHTSSLSTFNKRFFSYFTAFRILKFLNSVHPEPFPFSNVKDEFRYLSFNTSPSSGT